MAQLKLFLLAVTLIVAALLTNTATADSMYVGGKEYKLDPNEPALYQYIDKMDPAFEWHELNIPPVNNTEKGYVSYFVEFTSQQWLTESEVSRSIWSHNLTIVVPYNLQFQEVGTIFITGCRNGGLSCDATDRPAVETIAVKSGVAMAILHQIPNAQITYANDPEQLPRVEDAIVAYSWAEYLKNPSRPDQVVYFPMAKAAVMATKVLGAWAKAHPEIMGGSIPMEQFYFSGASKRGATTWFASAYMGARYPQNILGAAPLVFDTLNFTNSVPAMFQQLGGFTFAFKDYKANGILDALNDKAALDLLAKQVDPLDPQFQSGLDNVAKLVVNAAGDEFFTPLNDRYWFSTLKNKFRLQIPDAEHSLLTGLDYLHSSVGGHIKQLALKKPFPKWHHTMSYATNTISLIVSPEPTSVAVYKTFTPPSEPTRMDFRLMKANIPGGCLPPAYAINDDLCFSPTWWNATKITGEQLDVGFRYTYTPPADEIPSDGKAFLGFFIVAMWDNHPEMNSQVYSTQIMVLPDKYPFEECRPHCHSDLV